MLPQLPSQIQTEEQLDELLSRPTEALVQSMRAVQSPLLILGAAGKMGPSLALLARRAADLAGVKPRIVAVSRFSDPSTRHWLESRQIETIACDLFDRAALRNLPDTQNLIYLVGLKFGTGQNPAMTWAVNTLVPAAVAENFPGARIVALSTGNVYPLADVHSGGAVETTPLTPIGEYANAAVARERIFEYYSRRNGTPIMLVRLNYAVDLRYGVLLDIAQKVWAGHPVDLATGYLNCIWQGDANEMILRSLALAETPPLALNLTGPEVLSVRQLAYRLGGELGKVPQFAGSEAPTALLSDSTRVCQALGPPPTSIGSMLAWTAHWVRSNGRTLNKPTHFEVRDGKY